MTSRKIQYNQGMNGKILIIAGSDSGGGAGIQADIKTVTALGGYAATAVTALTAQNTEGVENILEVPESFIVEQIKLVLKDIGADVIKTGMLHKASVIEAVHHAIDVYAHDTPLVLDPVMVAKGGEPLLELAAIDALKNFLPRATIVTPNVPEVEMLGGHAIRTLDDLKHSAEVMLRYGCKAALVKGGHLEGDIVYDVLATSKGLQVFENKRIDTQHTHGTGCTLASAIATGLAQKLSLEDAVIRARHYVNGAIRNAPGYGKGHGPLNHGWLLKTA